MFYFHYWSIAIAALTLRCSDSWMYCYTLTSSPKIHLEIPWTKRIPLQWYFQKEKFTFLLLTSQVSTQNLSVSFKLHNIHESCGPLEYGCFSISFSLKLLLLLVIMNTCTCNLTLHVIYLTVHCACRCIRAKLKSTSLTTCTWGHILGHIHVCCLTVVSKFRI